MKPSPYMAEALAEAALGLGQTSPNPSVGCVLVKDEVIIGRGHHIYAGKNTLKSSLSNRQAKQPAGRQRMSRSSPALITAEPDRAL